MGKKFFFFIFNLYSFWVIGQDPQYSQFYANSLYLSPAFAGSQQNTRGIVAARYQWPSLETSFFSYTASLDHYAERYRSGVGLIVHSDVAAASNLKTTEAGIQYSYEILISQKHVFRPALQLSYVSKRIDISKLTFGSQYNNDGYVGGNSNESYIKNSVSYADVSSGGLLYSDNYWVGFSTHHMNQPNQSFFNDESRLPTKFSFFGGLKHSFTPDWRKRYIDPDEEKSISVTFLYKMQGKSDQLDMGLYGRHNALVAGVWYRGIPVKVYQSERTNHDALIFLIGIIHKGLNVGYSYDCTLSKLTVATGGSHELTVAYNIKHKEKKKIMKKLPCPKI